MAHGYGVVEDGRADRGIVVHENNPGRSAVADIVSGENEGYQ